MQNSLMNRAHHVILRDDDTNAYTNPSCLEWLYRPFLDRGFPVNLATIPAVSNTACREDGEPEAFLYGAAGTANRLAWIGDNRALVDYLLENPEYQIVQHGFDHSFKEFSIADPVEIDRRLTAGRAYLVDAGFPEPETFVAPHDQLSTAALAALIGRFKVVSTGWFEWRRIPLRWWPQYILKKACKRPHWTAGGTNLLSHPGCLLSRYRARAGMLESVRRAVKSQPLTVLVTHWWEYFQDGKPDDDFTAILHQVADFLADDPEVRVISFGDLKAPLGSRQAMEYPALDLSLNAGQNVRSYLPRGRIRRHGS